MAESVGGPRNRSSRGTNDHTSYKLAPQIPGHNAATSAVKGMFVPFRGCRCVIRMDNREAQSYNFMSVCVAL